MRLRASGDGEVEPAPRPRSTAKAPSSRRSAKTEPGFLELEHLLADHLDTRVSISGTAGKGRVVVEFADLADLERIYRAMVGG